MDSTIFHDPNIKPNDILLSTYLGTYFEFFIRITSLAEKFSQTWTYYRPGGWVLKVHDKKKALFYFQPFPGYCKVNLTIRQAERDQFLPRQDMIFIHKDLENAKKYPEGYAVYFDINSGEAENGCLKFISELIKLR